jgi:hypothetical protein
MASVPDRAMDLLAQGPLDDDELASRLGVRRQQVNQACRALASRGLLVREQGPDGKIQNRLLEGVEASGHVEIGEAGSHTEVRPPHVDLEMNLKRYLGARDRDARFASFDYCFNHFQAHRGPRLSALTSDAGMELSCLHLGFFLASWGMFRGSSRLLKRSARYYAPVVDTIASIDSEAWEIDAHAYNNDSIDHLVDVASRLRAALPGGASDTLVTKIMLGVFGCVPAFDLYFKRGYHVIEARGVLQD